MLHCFKPVRTFLRKPCRIHQNNASLFNPLAHLVPSLARDRSSETVASRLPAPVNSGLGKSHSCGDGLWPVCHPTFQQNQVGIPFTFARRISGAWSSQGIVERVKFPCSSRESGFGGAGFMGCGIKGCEFPLLE